MRGGRVGVARPSSPGRGMRLLGGPGSVAGRCLSRYVGRLAHGAPAADWTVAIPATAGSGEPRAHRWPGTGRRALGPVAGLRGCASSIVLQGKGRSWILSAFDVGICIDETMLNRVIASLYGRPDLRQGLFAGTDHTSVGGVEVSAAYDVQAVPTVRLAPPTPQQWQQAIQAGGAAATVPTANALVAHFPRVALTLAPGTPAAASTTVDFDAIAVAALAGGRLSITPLGVCVDLSGASTNDQLLYRVLVIPRVLRMLGAMLAAESVPNISFQGVRFGPAVVTLGAGRLAAVANLEGRPAPAPPSPEALPTVAFGVLLSRDAMQRVADAGTAKLRGKRLSQSGSASFGIGTAAYTANLDVADLALRVADPLTVDARVTLSASASASVDILGYVWDQITGAADSAAGTVVDGITTAANAVADAFSSY